MCQYVCYFCFTSLPFFESNRHKHILHRDSLESVQLSEHVVDASPDTCNHASTHTYANTCTNASTAEVVTKMFWADDFRRDSVRLVSLLYFTLPK